MITGALVNYALQRALHALSGDCRPFAYDWRQGVLAAQFGGLFGLASSFARGLGAAAFAGPAGGLAPTLGAPASGLAPTLAGQTPGAVSQSIVLGLERYGLQQIASRFGGQTLLRDPNWRTTFQQLVADPNTKFIISIEGLRGSSTFSQVMSAVQQGVGPMATALNWELAQLYAAQRLGSATFVNRYGTLVNPFR